MFPFIIFEGNFVLQHFFADLCTVYTVCADLCTVYTVCADLRTVYTVCRPVTGVAVK